DLTPALKDSAGAFRSRPHKFSAGGALVVAQVALSVVALIGAGLLVRTLENLRNLNPGFDPHNVLLFSIDPTLIHYKDTQIQSLYRDLRDGLAALPGVTSVSYSSDALLSGGLWSGTARLEQRSGKSEVHVDMLATGPDFLSTMRIPLLQGRSFTPADFDLAARLRAAETEPQNAASSPSSPNAPPTTPHATAPPAAIPALPVLVNREFVREYLADENPLGVGINRGKGQSSGASNGAGTGDSESGGWQIIGVVGDAKYDTLRRNIHPTIYVPFVGGGGDFELRTAADPRALISAVRSVAAKLNSDLPLSDVHTQTEQIDLLLWQERLVARVSSFFGLLALGLACVGLYGLLSYEVTRRTREIGIRAALGAQRGDILRLVVGRGILLTIAGLALGVALAAALTRFLASLLYGVSATDPLTFAFVVALLVLVALAACWIPARRAMKVEPIEALRYE
ncbi:MAG: FtsX-like permease family protein, partial [Candidatus Acidiferrales bacterium]